MATLARQAGKVVATVSNEKYAADKLHAAHAVFFLCLFNG